MNSQVENFVCECDEWLRSARKSEKFFKRYSNKNYCVLHYPDFDKLDAFTEAVQRKINFKNYDFKGVWFPTEFNFQNIDSQVEMDFSYAHFTKETKFSNTKFKNRINFSYAHFAEIVYFNWSEFHLETKFFHSHFVKNAWFFKTEFQKQVDFGQATFESKTFFHETNFIGEANFKSANIFGNISFKSATFQDYLSFDGHLSHEQYTKNTIFEFQDTRFKKPELVSFHSMTLLPYWFVDVDSRKLVFINTNWHFDIESEIKALEARGIYYPEKLFRIACQQLATNMEENNRYDEASKFRQIALEMERTEKADSLRKSFKAFSKKQSYETVTNKVSKYAPVIFFMLVKDFFLKLFNLLLHYFYRISSFYGESWNWAFVVLLIILAISTFLYTTSYCVFKDGKQSFDIWEAISYSLRVMALQRPEPFPENSFAKMVVALQTIFAPLQLALLALAIRRKFMR